MQLKRLILVGAFMALATPVWAQQPSVTYMPLTQSQQFLNRVIFNIVQTAPLIEVEAANYTPAGGDTHPATAACHSKRAILAAGVASHAQDFALVFAQNLVTTSNITTAGALTGAGATLDTPATDGALFSAVAAVWSTIAGCITNP
jgi:hypothetical protein